MVQRAVKYVKEHKINAKYWYFATLTIPHTSEESFFEVFNRLQDSWKQARYVMRNARNNKIKISTSNPFHHMKAGFVAHEVTKNASNGYHPHIHILFCSSEKLKITRSQNPQWPGKTIPKSCEELTRVWRSYGGGFTSMVKVKSKGGKPTRDSFEELFKYIVKGFNLEPEELGEVAKGLHKKNCFSKFGDFHYLKWPIPDKDKLLSFWKTLLALKNSRSFGYLRGDYKQMKVTSAEKAKLIEEHILRYKTKVQQTSNDWITQVQSLFDGDIVELKRGVFKNKRFINIGVMPRLYPSTSDNIILKAIMEYYEDKQNKGIVS